MKKQNVNGKGGAVVPATARLGRLERQQNRRRKSEAARRKKAQKACETAAALARAKRPGVDPFLWDLLTGARERAVAVALELHEIGVSYGTVWVTYLRERAKRIPEAFLLSESYTGWANTHCRMWLRQRRNGKWTLLLSGEAPPPGKWLVQVAEAVRCAAQQ